jgi:hypothetical protein
MEQRSTGPPGNNNGARLLPYHQNKQVFVCGTTCSVLLDLPRAESGSRRTKRRICDAKIQDQVRSRLRSEMITAPVELGGRELGGRELDILQGLQRPGTPVPSGSSCVYRTAAETDPNMRLPLLEAVALEIETGHWVPLTMASGAALAARVRKTSKERYTKF